MSMEFKVRTWLWITLAIVVTASIGFTTWYVSGGKEAKTTTSPTPTKPSVISPSAGTTITPTPVKTATQSGNQSATPASVGTLAWEGKMATKDLNCIPTISFKYPDSYSVEQEATPTLGGGKNLMVDKTPGYTEGRIAYISVSSYEQIGGQYQSISCVNPPYENLVNYAQRKEINNYIPLTINGFSAIQYTDSNSKKITAIQNIDRNIVTILHFDSNTSSEYYDIIVNSFQFK